MASVNSTLTIFVRKTLTMSKISWMTNLKIKWACNWCWFDLQIGCHVIPHDWISCAFGNQCLWPNLICFTNHQNLKVIRAITSTKPPRSGYLYEWSAYTCLSSLESKKRQIKFKIRWTLISVLVTSTHGWGHGVGHWISYQPKHVIHSNMICSIHA